MCMRRKISQNVCGMCGARKLVLSVALRRHGGIALQLQISVKCIETAGFPFIYHIYRTSHATPGKLKRVRKPNARGRQSRKQYVVCAVRAVHIWRAHAKW